MKEFRQCAPDGKEIWYYDAKVVFEFLIKEFNKRDKTFTRKKFFLIILASNLFGISPGIFRLFAGETFHGEGWLYITSFYLNGLSSGFMMLTALMFFTSAKIDMRRRSFILRQLGQMISPKKLITYKEAKLLPTINITDQLSLNTWLDLRKLAVDYGRKFFYRHEIFLPVVFCIGLVSLVGAFVLIIVGVETSHHVGTELAKMKYLLLLNVWILNFIFFSLLYQGAGINVEFSEHSNIMKKNKQIYNDLLFFQEFYFHPHRNK
jgi:hypothetical protein